MDKKTGYLLLLLGAAFIAGGAGLALASFYGGLPFPEPFALAGDLNVSSPNGAAVTIPMPPQINKAANLSFFFMLVFVLMGAGARLGNLGVKLIKEPPAPKDKTPK
ncbi:MAG: hypothetical protein A2X35_00275 [Elusimicrobia bacterium GWA2_61_42]|nr:MAG: hypothetical protein A2X35_00275 [Elusimicrobia bacterium GWA2_61_42]OGR74531.1 MAG: hypothetical protein A2X38_08025 [Elusimicrobia bacterium GWC2_61_25]